MNTHCQTIKFPNHDLDHHDASQLVSLQGVIRFKALLRSQTMLGALTILVILGLMLAFHQVVLGAVAQGESLQQARNLQSEAFWRCNRLLIPAERDNCRFRINAEVSASAP
ncbi:MAG: hypothetical protein CVU24_01330 [Betaproteobacteria bacterium HGW-Betaproteobacteria-18]|nr:MAG: hypothetical protein CVU24_01330 [Betaproteobacteria bacterium HGW-Betaproteobacteria-18]